MRIAWYRESNVFGTVYMIPYAIRKRFSVVSVVVMGDRARYTNLHGG